MVRARRFIHWRRILKGVAIAYGVSFAAGLVLALAGLTPQANPIVYPLLAIVTGAIGFAIALRVAHTTHWPYLVAFGTGFWLVCGTSVFVGAQTVTNWLASSVSVAATVILGRLFSRTGGEKPQRLDLSLCGILNDRNAGLLERRVRNFF